MEYREIKTIEQTVNKKGSKLWIQMNDNSKSEKNRQEFIKKNGGFFVKNGRYWTWTTPETEQNGYWLKKVETGEKTFFTSMTEFSKLHGMTPVKICELLNGKRKTYKGWTAVEIRQVKEGTGSHEKIKEKKPEKMAITREVTLFDRVTKQTIHVSNIYQFAKQNNLNKQNLYKVATGKLKSYKNLELYNPLKNNFDSSEEINNYK